jgi:hypothetical protein
MQFTYIYAIINLSFPLIMDLRKKWGLRGQSQSPKGH